MASRKRYKGKVKYKHRECLDPAWKLAVLIRDKFVCVYCGADIRNTSRDDATVDHVVCKKDGGTNDFHNLVASCGACNGAKGSLSVDEWCTEEMKNRIKIQLALPIMRHFEQATDLIAWENKQASEEENKKASKLQQFKKWGHNGILR